MTIIRCLPRRRLGMKRLVVSMSLFIGFVLTSYRILFMKFAGSILDERELFKKENIGEYSASYYSKVQCDDACQWEIEQRGRKSALDRYCATTNRNQSTEWAKWLLNHKFSLNHILISDKHKLLFCSIPKVSSTNWKNVFLILNGNISFQNISRLSLGKTHGNTVTLNGYNLTLDELTVRLDTYTSFLFVRNPFIRALSAFRDKFQSEISSDYSFIRRVYGPKINVYGNRSLKEDDPEYASATFPEYVKYLGDQRNRMGPAEDHWAPMSDLCFPCQKRYDVIGKLETYQTDTRFVLDRIGVPELYDVVQRSPPQTTNSSDPDQIHKFFSTLSGEDIEGLKRRYMDDFNLFGYDMPFIS